MGARENLRFPRRLRLRRQREFERLLKAGKRAGDHRLHVWALPNDRKHSRFGLVVGRRHGNAVRRNRIKRVLREAFRHCRSQLPRGLDLVCAPRVGADLELQETIRSLVRIGERLSRGFKSN